MVISTLYLYAANEVQRVRTYSDRIHPAESITIVLPAQVRQITRSVADAAIDARSA
jgi:hypothetical protein